MDAYFTFKGPKGFSIRYFWKPIIEGPGGGVLVEGSEIVTLFVPTTFAPPDKKWTFKDVLFEEKKTISSIEVEALLPRHVFSPGEEINFSLLLNNYSTGRITRVQSSLRKHYEGPLDKRSICEKHERCLVSTEKRCDIKEQETGNIEFFLTVPSKHHQVPPTFQGRHLKVYYTLRCVIQAETGKLFTKMQYHELTIPIAIAPYPHIPHDKVSVDMIFPSHEESNLLPFFFDPNEDHPPNDKENRNKSCKLSYDSILSLQLDDCENGQECSSVDKASDFT
ncbi:7033_t:CDS:2 [Acaulospora colombiana]|uniref:7033_t:CDS:1 n=1 Tax=Acaulospora colombiana TaxID=27376 RepID=A0ACA9KRG9_9GLOM|nr:7033_t:CDS:2 [Acaulospora colombiana]